MPTRLGARVRLRTTHSAGAAVATELEVVASEPAPDGRVVDYEVTLGDRVIGQVRRRVGEDSAEDPWFGYTPWIGGLVQSAETWRIPSELAPGVAFAGELRLSLPGLGAADASTEVVTTRTMRVSGLEHVSVPAGEFDAWRIEVNERTSTSSGIESQRSGAIWLARGPGLVRSVLTGAEGTQTTVLESVR